MQSWRIRTAIGAATTALVAGTVGAFVTTEASGAPVIHHRSFIAKQIYQHSIGKNSFVSSEVERHKGTVIGTDSITGKFDAKRGSVKIDVAVAWKGGALIIAGHATETTDFVGKIVRGTGKYTGATGDVTTRDLGHGRTAVHVTYTLR
jgi:hypothetical protein